jgi:hypothetical protein
MDAIRFQGFTTRYCIKVLKIEHKNDVRYGEVGLGRLRSGVLGFGEDFISPPEYQRTLPMAGKDKTKQGGTNGKIESQDYRRSTPVDAQHSIAGRCKSNSKDIQDFIQEKKQNRQRFA